MTDKYSEIAARFYDVVYDKLLDKAGMNFYLNEIRKANGRTLEVGVGTGRIFIPALNAGADIHGLDFSGTMLEILKGKLNIEDHTRLHYGDIREFNLKEKFDLIVAPFRVFQHMLTIDDQLNAMERIYFHLNQGGKFIFDVFVPDIVKLAEPVRDIKEFEGEYNGGGKLQRYAEIENDYTNQLLNVKFRYVWEENGKLNEAEHRVLLRYYFRYELVNLIARSNFSLENIYGDFGCRPLDSRSNDFVIICRK